MKTVTEIKVRSYHIDRFGHVNHARYLELLEEARWRYLEENDLLAPLHRGGHLHVVARAVIEYRKAARMGDVLRIETKIDRRSDNSFDVDQQIYISATGKMAVQAKITNAWVDRAGLPQPVGRDLLDIWPDLAGAAYSPSLQGIKAAAPGAAHEFR